MIYYSRLGNMGLSVCKMQYEDFDKIVETLKFPTPQGMVLNHQMLLGPKFLRGVTLQGAMPSLTFVFSSSPFMQPSDPKKVNYTLAASVVPLGILSGSLQVNWEKAMLALNLHSVPGYLEEQVGPTNFEAKCAGFTDRMSVTLKASRFSAAVETLGKVNERTYAGASLSARMNPDARSPINAAVRVGHRLNDKFDTELCFTADTDRLLSHQLSTMVSNSVQFAMRVSHDLKAYDFDVETGLRILPTEIPVMASVRADLQGNVGVMAGTHIGLCLLSAGYNYDTEQGSSFGLTLDFS